MVRSTAFFVNGGAGRVLTSIPAFEKFAEENPDDDFIIVCEGGTDFYKGHPILGKRAYDVWHKGLFEQFIKDRTCVTPEPYRVWEYYNQKCSLAQAFDIAINNKGVRDISPPSVYLNKLEITQGKEVVDEVKGVTGFDKVIVIQPFGRGVEQNLLDQSSRSFRAEDMLKIADILKQEYGIIVMSEFDLGLQNTDDDHIPLAQPQIPNLRIWAGVIKEADHFLGCDSVGQHMAKALGKSATVVTGSTFPINTSYVNDKDINIFDIGENRRTYTPIRLTLEEEPDRINDKAMDMTEDQIDAVVKSIKNKVGKSTRSAPRPPMMPTEDNSCCAPGGRV